jgi:phosphate transport system permease protein
MTTIASTSPRPMSLTGRRADWAGIAFLVAMLLCLLACFAFLTILLVQVFADGWGTIADRGTDFLTSDLSNSPSRAGVAQAIRGSLMLAGFVAVAAFPLGIATAVYLEEYARDNRFTSLVRLNIRNLAGVPSVVYGLLGLTVFVQWLGTDMSDGKGLTGGRSLLSGGLTLAVLVLPIVIITASEAIRAVPSTLREGAFGLGATQWEVVRTVVLPNAFAGILTGAVLSLSRALGETAPLILTGAFLGTFFRTPNQSLIDSFRGDYTALPMVIYNWAGEAKSAFKLELAPAAIIVLLAITLLCNASAVILRARYERDS